MHRLTNVNLTRMQKGLLAWLLFAAIFIPYHLSGQINFPAPAVEVFVEFKSDSVAYTPEDSLATYANDTIVIVVVVTIAEDAGVAKIHVKAGSSEGGAQLVEKAFLCSGGFDQGGGTTFKRIGKHAYLCLGKFYGVAEVHADVWLEDAGGNLSQIRTLKQAN